MRYGNSRPNSKKTKVKEIKDKERCLNAIANIEMKNISKEKQSYLEWKGERLIENVISLEEDIQKGNYTLKPFKRRRNMDLNKLKDLIMEDIKKRSTSDNWLDKRVSKEQYARKLEIKEHLVEQVFQKLNIEGVLSQRKPQYAHDTNRNPFFDGSESGWAEDIYEILI